MRPRRSHVLTVSGRIYHRTDLVDKWVTVVDPLRFFGAALRAALAEEGIEVAGQVGTTAVLTSAAATSSPWRPVLTHRTDLLTVLEVINRRSQNFYAECVLKLLGAQLCGEGSWAAGIRVVEEFLIENGLTGNGAIQMADGSGMSRNNRFTPRQVTALLWLMNGQRWKREFLRTLPYSGESDLSWEKRLEDPPYRGNVLAKTGALRGVSALSGYAKARSGKLYAFSILCNRVRTDWQAKKAQDRIVKALIDHG